MALTRIDFVPAASSGTDLENNSLSMNLKIIMIIIRACATTKPMTTLGPSLSSTVNDPTYVNSLPHEVFDNEIPLGHHFLHY